MVQMFKGGFGMPKMSFQSLAVGRSHKLREKQ